MFTLREDEKGRYVEPRRYSSGMKEGEYMQKAVAVNKEYFANAAANASLDAYFLSNPLQLDASAFTDADTVHADFHTDHEYMDHRRYQEIIRLTKPFIHAYIEQLGKDPRDVRARNLRYNAILNKADEIAQQLSANIVVHDVFVRATDAEIERLGTQDIRDVDTGCGASGEASGSAFSVSEFGAGSDQYGERTFACPKCQKTNVRPENELVASCQHCGGDVAC